jgi:hypothetical protein
MNADFFPAIVEWAEDEQKRKHLEACLDEVRYWRECRDWTPEVGAYCSVTKIVVPLKDGGNSPYCIYENARIDEIDWTACEVIATLDHWPHNRTREEWAASFGYKNGAVLRMSFLDFGPQVYSNAPPTPKPETET